MKETLEEKYRLIREEVLKSPSKDPIAIVKEVMEKDFVSIHGPEHHFLDGAAFLVAYRNAGGDVSLPEALDTLTKRATAMPGAMCGYWGICGSVASLGAALSILHKTGPLSSDAFYADHMAFTSSVLRRMSEIGGPRCCKRNAFLSISAAVDFVRSHYGIQMERGNTACEFSDRNPQCLGRNCPFHKN